MLNEFLARSFIEQLKSCTDYDINIMNKSGIVLSSSDPNRIGKFHEVAYRMVQENIDIMEVTDDSDFLGVKPGINMTFFYRKKLAGIVGITGPVDTVRTVAPVIKKLIELLMEREFGKSASTYHSNAKEQLLNYLLYLDVEPEDLHKVNELFDSLGYRRDLPRIPVVLSVQNSFQQQLPSKAKELLPLSVQDILLSDDKGHLVLFLSYPESLDGFFENYRFYIGDYLKNLLSWCRVHSIRIQVNVGPMQINPANYKYSYEKALWLEETVKRSENVGVYFYEHIGEYLKSKLPLIELHKIFEIFSVGYSPKFSQQLTCHMDVLHENNYNFQQSSNQLFIHKNTLAFRLDKIREQLGADPIQNLKDRELVEYLCYYLHQATLHQSI